MVQFCFKARRPATHYPQKVKFEHFKNVNITDIFANLLSSHTCRRFAHMPTRFGRRSAVLHVAHDFYQSNEGRMIYIAVCR